MVSIGAVVGTLGGWVALAARDEVVARPAEQETPALAPLPTIRSLEPAAPRPAPRRAPVATTRSSR
jgi:hypothetical protein